MGKRFDKIFESVVQRYNAGGYLKGDVVEFRPNYKSTPTYNNMSSEMKRELDELVNSGLNIRVTQVGDNLSGASAGNQFKSTLNSVVTVAGDHGGGRFYGSITVTLDMIDLAANQNRIPDQFKRVDKITIKPEPYSMDPQFITNVTDKGNGKNTPTNIKLGESAIARNDNDALANLYGQTL